MKFLAFQWKCLLKAKWNSFKCKVKHLAKTDVYFRSHEFVPKEHVQKFLIAIFTTCKWKIAVIQYDKKLYFSFDHLYQFWSIYSAYKRKLRSEFLTCKCFSKKHLATFLIGIFNILKERICFMFICTLKRSTGNFSCNLHCVHTEIVNI